jgi:hypothetical protein
MGKKTNCKCTTPQTWPRSLLSDCPLAFVSGCTVVAFRAPVAGLTPASKLTSSSSSRAASPDTYTAAAVL